LTHQTHRVYELGSFCLNTAEGQLLRDGQVVQITPKPFEAPVFCRETGRLIGRDKLLWARWLDSFVEEANLTHHVWRLRKILDENNEVKRYIETVPKRGYRFAGTVTTQIEERFVSTLLRHEFIEFRVARSWYPATHSDFVTFGFRSHLSPSVCRYSDGAVQVCVNP